MNILSNVANEGLVISHPLLEKINQYIDQKADSKENNVGDATPKDTLLSIQKNLQVISLNWLGKIKVDVLSEQQLESLNYIVSLIEFSRIQVKLAEIQKNVSETVVDVSTKTYDIVSHNDTYKTIENALLPILQKLKNAFDVTIFMGIATIVMTVDFLTRITANIKSDSQRIIERSISITQWTLDEIKKHGVGTWDKTKPLADSILNSTDAVYAKLKPILENSKSGIINLNYRDLVEAGIELQALLRGSIMGVGSPNKKTE